MSKKCTPLWREAHFEVKMYKTSQHWTTFGSWDVERVRAVVAGSTFRSQNVQSTPLSDDFWKLQCRKSARRCGAKHISKSKCTKHTIVGPLLEVEISKKCTPLWCEAHFEVKMYKAHHCRTTFGSCNVEKVHAVVARSTFRSQNVQSTPLSDHFWKLRRRKSARRCGAKHISKSKCTKHTIVGRLLEVAMSKKCTPLWREAHVEVKMLKAPGVRTTVGSWDVAIVHAVRARSTFRSQKCKKLRGTEHFWTFRCRFAWQAQGIVHLVKSGQNVRVCSIFNYNHHYTTNTTNTTNTTLHYATLHYILHYTTLHYTQLHYNYNYNYIPLHSATLNYTTLHYITLHYTTFHYTPLHYTTLHWMTLHHR